MSLLLLFHPARHGQQATLGQGTAVVDFTVALLGEAATGATGLLTAEGGDTGLSVGLTGSASTTAAGTLVPFFDLAPSGQASTGAAGTITSGSACMPSGQEATSAYGTIIPIHSAGLDGLETSLALGSFIAAQGLSGQELVSSQGTVTPSGGETPIDTDTFFDLRRRRRFGRTYRPLVAQRWPRRIR